MNKTKQNLILKSKENFTWRLEMQTEVYTAVHDYPGTNKKSLQISKITITTIGAKINIFRAALNLRSGLNLVRMSKFRTALKLNFILRPK